MLVTSTMAVAAPATWRTVIVSADASARALQSVEAVGGAVLLPLPIISGVAAKVPAQQVSSLRAMPGIISVTPNRRVHVLGASYDDTSPKSVYARETQADVARAAGFDGTGVTVALIDTGVANVGDLKGVVRQVPDPTNKAKIADCVNFSGEPTCNDSYGHGTFMAGLIAGNGSASGGRYAGVAPGAKIVSIKIAGRDGSADVTKVLAAIQWVVSFKDQLGIKVLNLSLGTNSPVSYTLDPLNFAVERAWHSGIVVVVSAGNRGEVDPITKAPKRGTISKPADDPWVITVGAVDDRESPGISDDRVPFFSAHGPTRADGIAKPDIVAPGGHVISLRSPGSMIEEKAPSTAIDGVVYRRGSGTSMSAAITSGLSALLLQSRPTWTPDRVKYAFVSTAHKVGARDPLWIGAGLVDVASAAFAPEGLANGGGSSSGSGSLEGSRGDVHVRNNCNFTESALVAGCTYVSNDDTAQGRTFDSQQYTSGEWTGSSWYASQWNFLLGSSWYGSSWYGSSWYGSSWYGSSWYGETDNTSYGVALPGSSWYGAWE